MESCAGSLYEVLCSLNAEIASKLMFGGNTPLPYSRAAENPFIARIDHFLKIVIGEDAFRHIGSDSCDSGAAVEKFVLDMADESPHLLFKL